MSNLGQRIVENDLTLHKQILRLVDDSAHHGITVSELRDKIPDRHHGHISGVLSKLHREMLIARLAESRNKCKIYVHPDYLDSRACEAQGSGVSKREIEFGQSLVGFLEYWMQVDTEGARFATDRTKAQRNHNLFLKQLGQIWEERP